MAAYEDGIVEEKELPTIVNYTIELNPAPTQATGKRGRGTKSSGEPKNTEPGTWARESPPISIPSHQSSKDDFKDNNERSSAPAVPRQAGLKHQRKRYEQHNSSESIDPALIDPRLFAPSNTPSRPRSLDWSR